MKKFILPALFTAIASSSAFAAAPGGPNCGWGNYLFNGKSGKPSHVMAATTNTVSGNATFGMTSGTNHCDTSMPLTYSMERMRHISYMLDELSEDMARGHGEALESLAVMLGVERQERSHFSTITHNNFSSIFTSADITAYEVASNITRILQQDSMLAKYVAS